MLEPQDLPGRYGRVVQALDHVLDVCDCESVVGGGWAVWRHGYVGRVTQDINIVLPSERIEEFLRAASVRGFEVLAQAEGRWPKLRHRETGIDVDILPEGGRPDTRSRPAPTTIPHPKTMGASSGVLKYISLSSLIELKLAAGRLRDEADIVEIACANRAQLNEVRQHLQAVHADYAARFEKLMEHLEESVGGSGGVPRMGRESFLLSNYHRCADQVVSRKRHPTPSYARCPARVSILSMDIFDPKWTPSAPTNGPTIPLPPKKGTTHLTLNSQPPTFNSFLSTVCRMPPLR